MTLKQRVIEAFTQAGLTWSADDTQAIALGGAALQCEDDRTAGLVCDVYKDQPDLMVRNAKLMTLLCTAAGWGEPECDQWIAAELRAAAKTKKRGTRQSTKKVGALTFTLSIDHPQTRLVVLRVSEA